MPQLAQHEVATADPLHAARVCLLAGKHYQGFTWKTADLMFLCLFLVGMRDTIAWFSLLCRLINLPLTVLFCALSCLSHMEDYRAGITQATTTKIGINSEVQHCYRSTIWPKRLLQGFFLFLLFWCSQLFAGARMRESLAAAPAVPVKPWSKKS